MREKGKNSWPQRAMSMFHVIQKSANWTLLNKEQKDNHVKGSVLISALERQEGAWNSCCEELRNDLKLGFAQDERFFIVGRDRVRLHSFLLW